MRWGFQSISFSFRTASRRTRMIFSPTISPYRCTVVCTSLRTTFRMFEQRSCLFRLFFIQAPALRTHPARSQSDSGPEYSIPLYHNVSSQAPVHFYCRCLLPRPNKYALVIAPPWGWGKEGARNSRSQKLCFRIANTQFLYKGHCGERASSFILTTVGRAGRRK